MVETSAFGSKLRRAREERGVALDAVASATRIARHHLEALEQGALESLPSGPFGRSYLRAYAEFLGIDPDPILDSYRLQEADKGLGPAESRERAARELSRLLERHPERKRFRAPAVLGGVAAVIALLALLWASSRSEPTFEVRAPLREGVGTSKTAPAVEASEPAPEPAPAKEPPSRTPITVAEWALGRNVVDHAPVGRASRFSEGERVVFWTRILAGEPGEVVSHCWLHEGQLMMKADLRVGGPHWRTYSRFTLPEGSSGAWAVEARDGSGRVLARGEFQCAERGE